MTKTESPEFVKAQRKVQRAKNLLVAAEAQVSKEVAGCYPVTKRTNDRYETALDRLVIAESDLEDLIETALDGEEK